MKEYVDSVAADTDTWNSSLDMQREASILISDVNASIYLNDSKIVGEIIATNLTVKQNTFDILSIGNWSAAIGDFFNKTQINTLFSTINTTISNLITNINTMHTTINTTITNKNTSDYLVFDRITNVNTKFATVNTTDGLKLINNTAIKTLAANVSGIYMNGSCIIFPNGGRIGNAC
jgi:hypothetical protein